MYSMSRYSREISSGFSCSQLPQEKHRGCTLAEVKGPCSLFFFFVPPLTRAPPSPLSSMHLQQVSEHDRIAGPGCRPVICAVLSKGALTLINPWRADGRRGSYQC